MRKLRPATLRHQIIVQRELEIQGSMWEVIKNWNNIKKTRAYINPISGNEWYIDSRLLNDIDTELHIRYMDLKPTDRIIFGSRVFDVVRVLNFEERSVFLMVLAKERLNEKYVSRSDDRVLEDGVTTRVLEDGVTTLITED